MSLTTLETLEDSIQHQAYTLFSKLPGPSWSESPSISASVYDTAWLSMVMKPGSSDTGSSWLFPECFRFILAEQLPSGAWESYAIPVDGILNTSAALLALRTRLRVRPEDPEHDDWQMRSHKAEVALKNLLSEWNVTYSDEHLRSEVLVMFLLEQLQDEGIHMDFPDLCTLRAIREEILVKNPPSTLYRRTSLFHGSLEAFVGRIDFNEVQSFRYRDGSMMGSPAQVLSSLDMAVC